MALAGQLCGPDSLLLPLYGFMVELMSSSLRHRPFHPEQSAFLVSAFNI